MDSSLLQGVVPLDPILTKWIKEMSRSDHLGALVAEYGSPLNVVNPDAFERNVRELSNVGTQQGIDFRIFFARKANKCLSFVDRARKLEIGVDTASLEELQQCVERGVEGRDLVCTAAVKSVSLFEYCIDHGVTIAIDNEFEFTRAIEVARQRSARVRIAFRLCGFNHAIAKPESRFGIPCSQLTKLLREQEPSDYNQHVEIKGLHFHLDGYDARERVEALSQCLALADELSECGEKIRFIDMGGGFPVTYLANSEQWRQFESEHRSALEGRRPAITYRNHGLGLSVIEGTCHGKYKLYPYYQEVGAAEWLQSILSSQVANEGATIAAGLKRRGIELRCEPGRALLNQAGMTVAMIEFVKRLESGEMIVGLAMNRTQCRTGSDDFTVDLLHSPQGVAVAGGGTDGLEEGYFVGAYCTESELISLRKFVIPSSVKVGDLVSFPNTAGYFMHFLESRSHQFPLAANLVVTDGNLSGELDPIETL